MEEATLIYQDDYWAVTNGGLLLYNHKFNTETHIISGVRVGLILKEVDGYYYWDASSVHGIWHSEALRKIADILDHLNKDWHEQVKRGLSEDAPPVE